MYKRMKTNIDIDDDLIDAVMATGLYKTKKDAVEAGLKLLKHKNAQLELIKFFGTIEFFDDVKESSTSAKSYSTKDSFVNLGLVSDSDKELKSK